MTKEQNEKATKLLGLLCDKGNLTNKQVELFFDNDNNEALFICGELEKMDLLRVVSDGIRILSLDKKEKTCNTFRNNLLIKDFEERERNEEIKQLEIELAKSNIEANKLNTEIARKNDKNKMSNNIATWINVSVGIINLVILIIQLTKAE